MAANSNFDSEVWASVYGRNEYQLPDDMTGTVVVDCGAHTGSFTKACLDRHCEYVMAFEPDPANVIKLRNIVAGHGNVEITQAAVWRSDISVDSLTFHTGVHTGAGAATQDAGATCLEWTLQTYDVMAIKFDDIIRRIRARWLTHKLLVKMDCEGGEFPVLLTSNTLRQVNRFVGEFHLWSPQIAALPPFTIKSLMEAFNKAGKLFTYDETPGIVLGAFQAE